MKRCRHDIVMIASAGIVAGADQEAATDPCARASMMMGEGWPVPVSPKDLLERPFNAFDREVCDAACAAIDAGLLATWNGGRFRLDLLAGSIAGNRGCISPPVKRELERAYSEVGWCVSWEEGSDEGVWCMIVLSVPGVPSR